MDFICIVWKEGELLYCYSRFKNKFSKFDIFNIPKGYVILDWSGSAFSFFNTLYIYRQSKDITSLGNSGWILSLLMTSLFISGATQYYAMFKNKGIYTTYLTFFPIIIVEIMFLSIVTNGTSLILIAICLIANVFFSAFRGDLMGHGKLQTASIWYMLEQVLRLLFIIFLTNIGMIINEAILFSSTIVYISLALAIIIILIYKNIEFKVNISIENIGEAVWYSFVHIGIFFALNGDVLSLKNLSIIKGDFVLIKPWGQVLAIIFTPLINIFLLSIKNNNSTTKIKYAMGLVFTVYSLTAFFVGAPLTYMIFGKHVYSSLFILLVIIEHLFIVLIVTMLYRSLYLKENHKNIILIINSSVVIMFWIPFFFTNYNVVLGYILIYCSIFLLYSKTVMEKGR